MSQQTCHALREQQKTTSNEKENEAVKKILQPKQRHRGRSVKGNCQLDCTSSGVYSKDL